MPAPRDRLDSISQLSTSLGSPVLMLKLRINTWDCDWWTFSADYAAIKAMVRLSTFENDNHSANSGI